MPRALTLVLLAVKLGACVLSARADDLADIQRLQAAGEAYAALQQADKALLVKPRDAQLRFVRGVLLVELTRNDEALDVFQRMNEDFPELPDPLNNIAVLHAAKGRLEPARAALEGALRNDPQHRAARENLADVYVRLAVQLWADLAASAPTNAGLTRRLRLARELLQAPG
jgi:Flp pilus assembly protein TadD